MNYRFFGLLTLNSLMFAASSSSSSISQQLSFSCPKIHASEIDSRADFIAGLLCLVRPTVLSTKLWETREGSVSQFTNYMKKHPNLKTFPLGGHVIGGEPSEHVSVFRRRAVVKARASDSKTIALLLGKPNPFADTDQEIQHAIYERLCACASKTRDIKRKCERLEESIRLGDLLRPEFDMLVATAEIRGQTHAEEDILSKCIPAEESKATLQRYKKYRLEQINMRYPAYQRSLLAKPTVLKTPIDHALYAFCSHLNLCETEEEELDTLKKFEAEITAAQKSALIDIYAHCSHEINALITAITGVSATEDTCLIA